MFDVGFAEVVLVFIVALVVFGPEKLPQLARNIGHWVGRAKSLFSSLKYELEREAHNLEIMERYKDEMDKLGLNDDNMNAPTPPNNNDDSDQDSSK